MAKPSLIRDIHQVSVLNLLRRHGMTFRAELAQELGLTRSTLTSLVSQLLDRGYVVESGSSVVRHGTGRPGVGLELNPRGASFVGADIGYGVLHTVVLDLAAETIARGRIEFGSDASPEEVLQTLADSIADVRTRSADRAGPSKGIGVSVPGTTADGRIVLSPGLGWRDVDVRDRLAAATGLPVLVENNANAAALAEVYLAQRGDRQTLVYVHLGSGIGSGIVVNGELFRGSFGAAGEIGNIRLAADGPIDRKGNRGTFEAFAASGALFHQYVERGGTARRAEDLAARYADDAAATAAVDAWSTWLGQVVLLLVNVLNPATIVLGGPLSPLAACTLERLETLVRREQLPGTDRIELVISELGEQSNAMGGAMLVYHTMFAVPALDESRPTAHVTPA